MLIFALEKDLLSPKFSSCLTGDITSFRRSPAARGIKSDRYAKLHVLKGWNAALQICMKCHYRAYHFVMHCHAVLIDIRVVKVDVRSLIITFGKCFWSTTISVFFDCAFSLVSINHAGPFINTTISHSLLYCPARFWHISGNAKKICLARFFTDQRRRVFLVTFFWWCQWSKSSGTLLLDALLKDDVASWHSQRFLPSIIG